MNLELMRIADCLNKPSASINFAFILSSLLSSTVDYHVFHVVVKLYFVTVVLWIKYID